MTRKYGHCTNIAKIADLLRKGLLKKIQKKKKNFLFYYFPLALWSRHLAGGVRKIFSMCTYVYLFFIFYFHFNWGIS